MSLAFKCIDRNLVVKFTGELDHCQCNKIKDEVDNLIDENNIKNVVFDFTNINFMDSSGIGIIMGRYRKIENKGGEVAVVNIKDKLDEILKISGLYNIADKYDSINEAVENMN